ncbi:hypothetical protein L4D06_05725 [Enterovibrio makurazakiensis]|uniref:hypothetical protein n=1 Tax=Enterovibrio makurazakiensis TaxID=2910232 RepID=UPI003D2149F0
MKEVRRWRRFICNPRVKGQLLWAHKFLPCVNIVITDISEKGIGFVSEWKLDEGQCELRVNSMPNFFVVIKHKGEKRIKGRKMYRYGIALRRKLHSVQMAQFRDAKKVA